MQPPCRVMSGFAIVKLSTISVSIDVGDCVRRTKVREIKDKCVPLATARFECYISNYEEISKRIKEWLYNLILYSESMYAYINNLPVQYSYTLVPLMSAVVMTGDTDPLCSRSKIFSRYKKLRNIIYDITYVDTSMYHHV